MRTIITGKAVLRKMRFAIIFASVFLLAARCNVIPNSLHRNDSLHSLSKIENYQNVWVNNNQPLEICPVVEASLAAAVKSRMGDKIGNKDGIDFGKYFVTIGDVQSQISCSKEHTDGTQAKNFCDIKDESKSHHNNIQLTNAESTWDCEKPGYAGNTEKHVMGYLNSENIMQEPSGTDDLRIVLNTDDLANIKLPAVEISQQEAPLFKEIVDAKDEIKLSPEKWNNRIEKETGAFNQLEEEISPKKSKVLLTNMPITTESSEEILQNYNLGNQKIGKSFETTTIMCEMVSELNEPISKESKRKKLSAGELKRTSEIINEILEKFKQIDAPEHFRKYVEKIMESFQSEIWKARKISELGTEY